MTTTETISDRMTRIEAEAKLDTIDRHNLGTAHIRVAEKTLANLLHRLESATDNAYEVVPDLNFGRTDKIGSRVIFLRRGQPESERGVGPDMPPGWRDTVKAMSEAETKNRQFQILFLAAMKELDRRDIRLRPELMNLGKRMLDKMLGILRQRGLEILSAPRTGQHLPFVDLYRVETLTEAFYCTLLSWERLAAYDILIESIDSTRGLVLPGIR